MEITDAYTLEEFKESFGMSTLFLHKSRKSNEKGGIDYQKFDDGTQKYFGTNGAIKGNKVFIAVSKAICKDLEKNGKPNAAKELNVLFIKQDDNSKAVPCLCYSGSQDSIAI